MPSASSAPTAVADAVRRRRRAGRSAGRRGRDRGRSARRRGRRRRRQQDGRRRRAGTTKEAPTTPVGAEEDAAERGDARCGATKTTGASQLTKLRAAEREHRRQQQVDQQRGDRPGAEQGGEDLQLVDLGGVEALRQDFADQRGAAGDQRRQRRGDQQHRVAEAGRDGVGDHLAPVGQGAAPHVGDPRHAQGEAGGGDQVAGEEVGVGEDGRVTGVVVAGEGEGDDEEGVEGEVDQRCCRGSGRRSAGERAQAVRPRRPAPWRGRRGRRGRRRASIGAGDDRHRQHRPAERELAGGAGDREVDDQAGDARRRCRRAAMRSKRSRTASSVAPPAAQSCRIIAMPSIGRADSVTPRPASPRPGASSAGQRSGQRDRHDRDRDRDRDQGDRELARCSGGAGRRPAAAPR